ncbi:peptidase dimerization domain-containing protein [Neobacillus sp. PS3-34]|uniref:peptidase dimerization domain-containing protein n=1 Tax=Neobacillus sp. PS3-34 TaxID=3070678 RepID=UPI0035A64A31
MISDIQTPNDPKTTFNVGTINGGTSVNTISASANMLIDMRSVSPVALTELEDQVITILKKAAEEENKRWDTDQIQVDIKLVGDTGGFTARRQHHCSSFPGFCKCTWV